MLTPVAAKRRRHHRHQKEQQKHNNMLRLFLPKIFGLLGCRGAARASATCDFFSQSKVDGADLVAEDCYNYSESFAPRLKEPVSFIGGRLTPFVPIESIKHAVFNTQHWLTMQLFPSLEELTVTHNFHMGYGLEWPPGLRKIVARNCTFEALPPSLEHFEGRLASVLIGPLPTTLAYLKLIDTCVIESLEAFDMVEELELQNCCLKAFHERYPQWDFRPLVKLRRLKLVDSPLMPEMRARTINVTGLKELQDVVLPTGVELELEDGKRPEHIVWIN